MGNLNNIHWVRHLRWSSSGNREKLTQPFVRLFMLINVRNEKKHNFGHDFIFLSACDYDIQDNVKIEARRELVLLSKCVKNWIDVEFSIFMILTFFFATSINLLAQIICWQKITKFQKFSVENAENLK